MQQGKHQEYEKKLYEQYNVVLRYVITGLEVSHFLEIESHLVTVTFYPNLLKFKFFVYPSNRLISLTTFIV